MEIDNSQDNSTGHNDIGTVYSKDQDTAAKKTKDAIRRPKARPRTEFSSLAMAEMLESFHRNQYAGIEERERLAGVAGVSEARIQVWFQNRRARKGREKKGKMAPYNTTDTFTVNEDFKYTNSTTSRTTPTLNTSTPPSDHVLNNSTDSKNLTTAEKVICKRKRPRRRLAGGRKAKTRVDEESASLSDLTPAALIRVRSEPRAEKLSLPLVEMVRDNAEEAVISKTCNAPKPDSYIHDKCCTVSVNSKTTGVGLCFPADKDPKIFPLKDHEKIHSNQILRFSIASILRRDDDVTNTRNRTPSRSSFSVQDILSRDKENMLGNTTVDSKWSGNSFRQNASETYKLTHFLPCKPQFDSILAYPDTHPVGVPCPASSYATQSLSSFSPRSLPLSVASLGWPQPFSNMHLSSVAGVGWPQQFSNMHLSSVAGVGWPQQFSNMHLSDDVNQRYSSALRFPAQSSAAIPTRPRSVVSHAYNPALITSFANPDLFSGNAGLYRHNEMYGAAEHSLVDIVEEQVRVHTKMSNNSLPSSHHHPPAETGTLLV